MELIDTHAHLDDEQFAADLDGVLDRARATGLAAIVTVGTTAETSRQAVLLARRYPLVYAAVGIHPNDAAGQGPEAWQEIMRLASEPEVVAIGETGLDRYREDTPFAVQREHFERQAAFAHERQLPVVIHCRDAEPDVLAALESVVGSGPLKGVMHSFSGSAATAARCLELGLHISFAGQVSFGNRKFDGLREVARIVPLSRLLVETDSPYLAPEPHRGARNEPSYVARTATRLAELRGIAPEELAQATSDNARRLFNLREKHPP